MELVIMTVAFIALAIASAVFGVDSRERGDRERRGAWAPLT